MYRSTILGLQRLLNKQITFIWYKQSKNLCHVLEITEYTDQLTGSINYWIYRCLSKEYYKWNGIEVIEYTNLLYTGSPKKHETCRFLYFIYATL